MCVARATFSEPVLVQVPVAGSYSSALGSTPPVPVPPTTRTLPFWSSVAVCPHRAVVSVSVPAQTPVAGENSSALFGRAGTAATRVTPPATSTWPVGRSVAVWNHRPVPMLVAVLRQVCAWRAKGVDRRQANIASGTNRRRRRALVVMRPPVIHHAPAGQDRLGTTV